MRIIDGKMTVDLPDGDARVVRIRAILFEQPAARDPIGSLWTGCSTPQRQVLAEIANAGEISQVDLELALKVDGVGLRGRLGGLAKIAKRLNVPYPIQSTGGRRDSRRFSLDPDVARQISKLHQQGPKPRRTK